MKWNVDPMFDPLQELQDCKEQIEMLKQNNLEIARGFNAQSKMIQDLSEQTSRLIYMISAANNELFNLTHQVEQLKQTK